MYINEQYHDLPLLETKEYRFISRDGQLISKQEQILKEHLIDVYLNDHLTMKLVCLPQYLTELVLGRLLTERIIDSISDIEQIYICEYGKRAKVYLNRTSETLPQNTENNLFIEITPTCCTGNHTCHCTETVHSSPENRKKNNRTESRTKACPSI